MKYFMHKLSIVLFHIPSSELTCGPANLPSQEFFISKEIVEMISIRVWGEPLCFGVFQPEGQGWFHHISTSNRTTSRSLHDPRHVNKPTNYIFKLRAAVHGTCQLLEAASRMNISYEVFPGKKPNSLFYPLLGSPAAGTFPPSLHTGITGYQI